MGEIRKEVFVSVIIGFIVVILAIVFGPSIVRSVNDWRADMDVAHYETDLDTLVQLEDRARATVSQWIAAYTRYEQFKDSDDREERNWANSAQMQANNLAATYNTFMLEHSATWVRGIPDGLQERLPLLPLADDADTPWPMSGW